MTRDTEERQLETVQALFAATGSGNWAAAEEMLTPDFFVSEADNNPFAGVYRGRQALRDLFERVVADAGVAKLDIKQLTVGGDLVIAMVEMVLGGPPESVVTLAEVFRFKNGMVCEIKPHYFDSTPLAAAVAARRPPSAG